MRARFIIFAFFIAVLIQSGCKNNQEGNSQVLSGDEVSQVPDDFRVFYDRFHTDTNYQITHIVFPLDGLPANADTLEENEIFHWQKETWRWHRPMDPNLSGYERQWEVLSPSLITEKIVEKTSNIGMVRRFAHMGDDWMLIYYAAMNPLP